MLFRLRRCLAHQCSWPPLQASTAGCALEDRQVGERSTTGMATGPTTAGAISGKLRTARRSRTEVSSATTRPALRG
jgi:hypothetical protein